MANKDTDKKEVEVGSNLGFVFSFLAFVLLVVGAMAMND